MVKKSDLINTVAEASQLSKKDAKAAIDATFATIKDSLSKGEKVQLIGFGSFDVHNRSARAGRNPQTGAKIQIPATKAPVFKAGKELKAAVK